MMYSADNNPLFSKIKNLSVSSGTEQKTLYYAVMFKYQHGLWKKISSQYCWWESLSKSQIRYSLDRWLIALALQQGKK